VKQDRFRKTIAITSFLSYVESRKKEDMKVEKGLSRKRKGTGRWREGIRKDNRGKYDESMLYVCMKLSR
jgi:hypothetical protein